MAYRESRIFLLLFQFYVHINNYARAGEAGKGFSVVALEVGKLAKSCTDLNNRITSTVENISDVIHDMADIGNR